MTPTEKVLHASNIENTLRERGSRYGTLLENGQVAQAIKASMRASQGWRRLTDDKKEALDMIASKIARVLAGDPEYADNFHDIVGYAKLVEDSILGRDSIK